MVRRRPTRTLCGCGLAALLFVQLTMFALGAEEDDFYRLVPVISGEAQTESRSKAWRPAPEGLVMEVSGLTPLDGRRLAVAIRRGEIWILEGAYDDPPSNVRYHRFASALHEPLGLL